MKTTTDGGSNIYPVHAGKLEVLVALATSFDHSETQKESMKRLRSYLDSWMIETLVMILIFTIFLFFQNILYTFLNLGAQ